jgi:hypothetical protein
MNNEGTLVEGSDKPEESLRSVIRFESDSENLDFKITDINHMVYQMMGL